MCNLWCLPVLIVLVLMVVAVLEWGDDDFPPLCDG